MQYDPTNQDILDAINDFASHVDGELSGLKSDVSGLKTNVSGLKSDVSCLKSDIATIKATMVTKSYLDDKLADLRGDLVSLVRKEDDKVNALIKVAVDEGVVSRDAAQEVLVKGPFTK